MGNRSKYRKLPDLFVTGKEVVFESPDGSVIMWVQVLNPFEMQECRNAAQAARSRVTLAVKTMGSPEYDTALAAYMRLSKDVVIDQLAQVKYTEWYLGAQNDVESDPDWAERMQVLRSADDATAAPLSDEESAYLATLNAQYIAAVETKIREDEEFFRISTAKLDPTELQAEYMDAWLDRRGQDAAMGAYNLTELFYGTRICDAEMDAEGGFTPSSHAKCGGHKERVFEFREEVRDLPEEMQQILRTVYDDLTMTVREAKNSDRQGSSSDSSPLPSTPEESTSSTSTETSEVPPGS